MRFDSAERRIIFSRVFRTVSARACARLWRLGAPSGGVDARREARPAFVRRRRRLRGPQLVRRRDVGVCGGCERCCCVAEQPSNARGGRLERRWTYCFRARKPCRGARKGRPRVVQCARRARMVSARAPESRGESPSYHKLAQLLFCEPVFAKVGRHGLQSSERSQAIPNTSRTNQQANTKKSRPASTSPLHVPHTQKQTSRRQWFRVHCVHHK